MKHLRVLFCAAFFLTAAGIFAQTPVEVVIRDLLGTVEVKAPRAANWTAARKGQILAIDTVISTGFRSSAVVAIGNSTLTIQPLTRLSFKELSQLEENEKVELQLRTGRVRAEVRPPRVGRTNFTVSSPIATASVRGTIFEFDTFNLSVSEGTVEFSGAAGASVLVDAGSTSSVDSVSSRASPPSETELKPELPVAAEHNFQQSGEEARTVELSIGVTF
jgi:hypothetical protein